MIANSTFFGSELRREGINLEGVIKGCKKGCKKHKKEHKKECKEITLDYEWYFKGEAGYRRYIGFYVDSQEIARVYLKKGPVDNPDEARKILLEAYASLKKEVKLPKRVKVNAVYLKGSPRKEQILKIK